MEHIRSVTTFWQQKISKPEYSGQNPGDADKMGISGVDLCPLALTVQSNVKATGLYFLIGVLLSALFQRYVPAEAMTALFGGEEALGVLMAATIGVPLYACGGGTIPLLQQWLWDGMSEGNAASFMLTGPSTKITNLGALKIVLGIKRFLLYLAYVMVFSLITGLIVNLIL